MELKAGSSSLMQVDAREAGKILPRARMTLPRNQHKVHRSEHKEPTKSKGQEKEHKDQLERLREKDPEFYEFLKEHEKELLHFNDEDADLKYIPYHQKTENKSP